MEVRYQSELKWNLQENHFYVPTTTLIIPLFCVMSLVGEGSKQHYKKVAKLFSFKGFLHKLSGSFGPIKICQLKF